MEEPKLKEKDFQRYVGWETPLFIKIAWVGLALWIATYLIKYLIPALSEWLKR